MNTHLQLQSNTGINNMPLLEVINNDNNFNNVIKNDNVNFNENDFKNLNHFTIENINKFN
jgi:hypothetical protein